MDAEREITTGSKATHANLNICNILRHSLYVAFIYENVNQLFKQNIYSILNLKKNKAISLRSTLSRFSSRLVCLYCTLKFLHSHALNFREIVRVAVNQDMVVIKFVGVKANANGLPLERPRSTKKTKEWRNIIAMAKRLGVHFPSLPWRLTKERVWAAKELTQPSRNTE